MISKLTLKTRLILIVLTALLGMLLLAVLSAQQARTAMLDGRKAQLPWPMPWSVPTSSSACPLLAWSIRT